MGLPIKLFNSLFILIAMEGLFNTDTYSLKNMIGQLSYMLINIIFIGIGISSSTKKINYISLSLLFFILISVFSGIFNNSGLSNILEFFLRYGKIYFVCLTGYFFFNKLSITDLYLPFSILNILNFTLNTLFFLQIRFIPNKWIGTLDFATGVLGDALYQCFFSLIVASFSFILMKRNKSKFSLKYIFFNLITASIQIVWSNSFHLYLLILFALLVTIFLIENLLKSIKIIIPIILIIFTFFRTIDSDFYQYSIISLLNSSPKVSSYIDTFSGSYQNSFQKFIGVGPGKGGSYIAIKNQSYVAENYFSIYTYFTDMLRREGSITTLPNTAITTLQSELGYLGLINYVIFIFMILKNLTSKILVKEPLSKISLFIILVYFLENILADYLQHSIMPILTFLLAGIALGKKKNDY
tara:strand:+ start:547 stop:1782 length:1236 start_codon:yes stop_codon:yes gene_type:complete